MSQIHQLLNKWRLQLFCALGFGALVFFLHGHILFSGQQVLSMERSDVYVGIYSIMSHVHEGLRQGELTTWSPYMFGGMPLLGEGQYQQLYLPNWIVSHLPTAVALNWLYSFHTWLMGFAMYCWARYRGFNHPASFVTGTAMMLGGAFFPHIMAGHIMLGTYSWTPLVFLGIDGWLKERKLAWIFLSAAAAAMQIYVGFIQIFYHTALFSGLYALLYLFEYKKPWSAMAGLVAIYPLALMLAAAQFLPELGASFEAIRSKGLVFENSSAGLPGENLLLVLFPWLLGGGWNLGYWGKIGGFHELVPFAGCGMFLMAALAIARYKWSDRLRMSLLMSLPLVLALGSATPLYKLFYDFVPMFSHFRAPFRFIFIFALFFAIVAGDGLNRLLNGEKTPKLFFSASALFGGFIIIAGITINIGDTSWFLKWVQNINAPPYHYFQTILNTPLLQAEAIRNAGDCMVKSGIWIAAFSILPLVAGIGFIRISYPALCVAELVIFAMPLVKTLPIQMFKHEYLANFLKANPGDYRVLYGHECANVMLKSEALWGSDPVIMRRYAELLFHSQGYDLNAISHDLGFRRNSKIFPLLRAKYAKIETSGGPGMVILADPFPRFFMANKYRIIKNRDDVLETLTSSEFDLRNEAILERDPKLETKGEAIAASIEVTKSSLNEWNLHIKIDKPGVLIMTDAYSMGWNAEALAGSIQKKYDLQPADWALRGIPMQQGEHFLRIKYTPWGLYPGLLLSTISWLGIIVAFGISRRRKASSPHGITTHTNLQIEKN